jgi:hypothetical protein
MQVTITLGLEELKLLPEELRQKIQSSLGLPVVTPQQVTQAYVQQAVPEILQPAVTVVPGQYPAPAFTPPAQQAMPTFAPPVQQVAPPQSMPAPPIKQAVVQNGIPTFTASRGGLDQQSVAIDVLSNQPVSPATPSSAPVMPQFNQAPLTVAPVTTGVAAMASMPSVTIDPGTVRAAAIRTHNNVPNGKQIVAAAQTASGVSIAGLDASNAHLLANALRQQGVEV